jgi:hypothetical protein
MLRRGDDVFISADRRNRKADHRIAEGIRRDTRKRDAGLIQVLIFMAESDMDGGDVSPGKGDVNGIVGISCTGEG